MQELAVRARLIHSWKPGLGLLRSPCKSGLCGRVPIPHSTTLRMGLADGLYLPKHVLGQSACHTLFAINVTLTLFIATH